MADYGTNDGFRTYHAARGRTVDLGVYSNAQISAKRIIASDWIDARYRRYLTGSRVDGRTQDGEWPRTGVVDANGYSVSSASVPTEIVNAVYEAALKELETAGSLSKDYTPPKYKRVSIDGSLSVEYADRQASEVQSQFQIIDEILEPLLGMSEDISAVSSKAVRA